MIAKVSRMPHASITYALDHREEALAYALQYGRGLDRAKADRFVGMYVDNLMPGVHRREPVRCVAVPGRSPPEGHHSPQGPRGVRRVVRQRNRQMNRRDFLTGAASGVTSAGLIGIAGRAIFDRPAPKGSAPAVTTKATQAPPATPAPTARHPKAAPQVATDYKGRVSFAQEGEDLILYDLLHQVLKLENPSYLDIGAGDPVLSNNTYVLYGTGSRGVLVEPNPTLTKRLKSVRSGDVVVNAGVGVKDTGEADYYVIRGQWPLNTFSLEDVAILRKQYTEDPVEKVIKMPLIQINRLIAEHFETAPDLLSIDIEGMDLDVLKSMNFKAHRPATICAETKQAWESHDNTAIARFLRTKGYVPCAGSLYNTVFADGRRLAAARRAG